MMLAGEAAQASSAAGFTMVMAGDPRYYRLKDGFYQLTVDPSNLFDAAGNTFDGDDDDRPGGALVDEFFRFFGDSDGDLDVDGQDYGRFASAFLSRLGDDNYDSVFDSDGDGDGQDYGRFGRNFLKTLGTS